ncbi:hypothetical protein [Legionella brunensis]|uniref:Effector protein B, substrate of the Dot/Icm secretion system n=1 Tax=Legionella brunensis TaxID=29422 RepID=A0A0W0SDS4_9GAMM|nr:hypothetical protein [Legionella brunensis]KTC81619.1 hypothetical protein Lbru_2139 [Legionella brunensis]
MAKTKKFKIRRDYLANYGGADHTNSTSFPVPTSNYKEIYASLLTLVRANRTQQLEKTLTSEFIDPQVLEREQIETHNSFPESEGDFVYFGEQLKYIPNTRYGMGQRDTDTFETHRVAPVLEELVIHHFDDFVTLLKEASPGCQAILLNFTDLDLTGLDFTKFQLAPPSILTQSIFTRAKLKSTKGLTQQILDDSQDYIDAQLPERLVPFWTQSKKEKVLEYINQLSDYGNILSKSNFEAGRQRGQLANELALELKGMIASASKHNGTFQKQFLKTLHQHDEAFSDRRFYGIKMIIANLSLFILGFGIGYAAAVAVNYRKTGNCLFFNKTETQRRVEKIQSEFKEPIEETTADTETPSI